MTDKNFFVLSPHNHSEKGGRDVKLGTIYRTPRGQYAAFCGYLEDKKVGIIMEDLETLLKNNNQEYTVRVQLINHSDLNHAYFHRFVKWIVPNKIKKLIVDSLILSNLI